MENFGEKHTYMCDYDGDDDDDDDYDNVTLDEFNKKKKLAIFLDKKIYNFI